HRCTRLDVEANTLDVQQGAGGPTVRVHAACVVGCDGAYSVIRSALQHRERFNYSQDYLSHGYKELTIPPGPGGAFRMEKHALHIWPRRRFMLIALPNQDGSFTCTLFIPYDGEPSFATLQTPQQVLAFFEQQFPDALPLM